MRALTRVATSENEAELLDIGMAATATQCERICRTFRKVMAPGRGADAEAARRVSVREGDDGAVRVSVVLPADEGARFVASMDSAKEMLDREAPRGGPEDRKARHSRADGLMAVVEGWFSAEPRPRRGGAPNEVILHVTADALCSPGVSAETSPFCGTCDGHDRVADGAATHVSAETPPGGCAGDGSVHPAAGATAAHVSAETAVPMGCACEAHVSAETSVAQAYIDNLGGAGVSPETARRLACDASLVPVLFGPGGEVLDVGRKRRTVPPATARAVEARFGRVCAFPGCTHTLFLDHHHIEHWANGGETKPDNLLLLCRHHHTFVHEHGWTVEMTGGGPHFTTPNGRRIDAAPTLGPVDIVALQDRLPASVAEQALCATGGWEPVDYPEIIHALAEATHSTRSSCTERGA